jgi:polygalacturonase
LGALIFTPVHESHSSLCPVLFIVLPVMNLLFAPPLTAAEDKVMDATKAGAVGDGMTLNTATIQKVIDDCAAGGGGTIRFPAGRYMTGTIQIKSNVTLRLEKDAMLLGSTDIAEYRDLDPFIDGVGDPMGYALVVAGIRRGARMKTFRAGDQPKSAPGKLTNVTIKNVSAKNIRTIGMLINGVPGHPVEALTFDNIQIELPGGGTAEDAKVQLPEKETAYPENRMFGTRLPAYGIYARHVRGVKLKNVRTTPLKPDARPATVWIDVEDLTPATSAPESSNRE